MSGRLCPFGCGGRLRNIDGKRHTIERLDEIHRESCPAVRRVAKKKETTE